jgi:DNA-binding LytR/AlgR family response regulator
MSPRPTSGGLRVLAVDDELPALEDLGRLLEASETVEAVVLANGGAEALHRIADQQFDVIFLDVRMPEIDGLELASLLGRFASPPGLVFVSAYEDGAVGAIEQDLHPVDYLMKPVSRARVEQALGRVVAGEQRPAPATDGGSGTSPASTLPPGTTDEIIPVEHQRGGATRLLERSSILYVQAEGDYVRIHADSGRYLVRAALSDVERRWGPYGFVRVHRSYVANLHRAVEIRPELSGAVTIVFADGSRIPVARRQVADLRRRLRM